MNTAIMKSILARMLMVVASAAFFIVAFILFAVLNKYAQGMIRQIPYFNTILFGLALLLGIACFIYLTVRNKTALEIGKRETRPIIENILTLAVMVVIFYTEIIYLWIIWLIEAVPKV